MNELPVPCFGWWWCAGWLPPIQKSHSIYAITLRWWLHSILGIRCSLFGNRPATGNQLPVGCYTKSISVIYLRFVSTHPSQRLMTMYLSLKIYTFLYIVILSIASARGAVLCCVVCEVDKCWPIPLLPTQPFLLLVLVQCSFFLFFFCLSLYMLCVCLRKMWL